MALPWTTSVLKVTPQSATGVAVTPSGTAWTWTAWTEVIASASADLIIGALCPHCLSSQDCDYEVQIGIGALGAEVAVTQYRGTYGTNGSTEGTTMVIGNTTITHPVLLDAIPSGSRVSLRLRKSGTSILGWSFALTYYEKPIAGTMNTSSQPVKNLPDGAVALSFVVPSGTYVDSAYQQFTASLPVASVLLGVVVVNRNNSHDCRVKIAVGAAGSEQVVATFLAMSNNADASSPFWYPLPVPLDVFPVGSRIAASVAQETVAFTTTAEVSLVYMEKPL